MNLSREKQIHLLDGMLEAVKSEELRRQQFKEEATKIAAGLGFGINWNTYEKGPLYPLTFGQTWQCLKFPEIKAKVINCENEGKVQVKMSYKDAYSCQTFLSLDHLQSQFRLAHDPRKVKPIN